MKYNKEESLLLGGHVKRSGIMTKQTKIKDAITDSPVTRSFITLHLIATAWRLLPLVVYARFIFCPTRRRYPPRSSRTPLNMNVPLSIANHLAPSMPTTLILISSGTGEITYGSLVIYAEDTRSNTGEESSVSESLHASISSITPLKEVYLSYSLTYPGRFLSTT